MLNVHQQLMILRLNGLYKDLSLSKSNEKRLLFPALFICFLFGCSNEYELKVVLDEEVLTYKISNNEFNVDSIEKKANYDYF